MTTLSNHENQTNVSYGKAEEMGICGPYTKSSEIWAEMI